MCLRVFCASFKHLTVRLEILNRSDTLKVTVEWWRLGFGLSADPTSPHTFARCHGDSGSLAPSSWAWRRQWPAPSQASKALGLSGPSLGFQNAGVLLWNNTMFSTGPNSIKFANNYPVNSANLGHSTLANITSVRSTKTRCMQQLLWTKVSK